jgi:hypothetical protein
LPAPFSPTNACASPFVTSRLTSFSATTPGYFFVIFCNCKIYIIIYASRCNTP